MKKTRFTKPSGKLIKNSDGDLTFIPSPLPPQIEYDRHLVSILSKADKNLGMLAGIGQLLPNPHILISPYIRREAVLSSRIEGTMASLSDLFLYEITKREPSDYMRVREVRNYVFATTISLKALKKGTITLDLMRKAHKSLLYGVRGEERFPGNFREIQNWIGDPSSEIEDAVYVPPPWKEVPKLLLDLESFLRNPPKDMPPLIQCALVHYQFETIHPFLDGNGRIGRLLITLFLDEKKLLPQPLLYLSAYLEENKREYGDRLTAVREESDVDGWLKFFLRGVSIQAEKAIRNVDQIVNLQRKYQEKLRKMKSTTNAIRLVDSLFLNPYTTITNAAQYLRVSFPTGQRAIKMLEEAGILKEFSKRKRNRIYIAKELMRILESR